MAERNTEVIRTELAAERGGLEGDLMTLKGDLRRFAVRVAIVAVAAVIALFLIRWLLRLLFKRS
jgi:hypothetical protein